MNDLLDSNIKDKEDKRVTNSIILGILPFVLEVFITISFPPYFNIYFPSCSFGLATKIALIIEQNALSIIAFALFFFFSNPTIKAIVITILSSIPLAFCIYLFSYLEIVDFVRSFFSSTILQWLYINIFCIKINYCILILYSLIVKYKKHT